MNARDPQAWLRARAAIDKGFDLIASCPGVGRPFAAIAGLREYIIRFGNSGYIVLYRHEPDEGAVHLLSFRHQREAEY